MCLPGKGRENTQQNEHMKRDSHHWSARNLFFVIGRVHITPEEFENGDITLKTHQIFSVLTAPENF